MRQYTQRELLDEGFWDLRKSPILRGIGKVAGVAKRASKYAVPELYQYGKGIKDAALDIAGVQSPKDAEIDNELAYKIDTALEQQGYDLDAKRGIYPTKSGYMVHAIDKTPQYDSQGNEIPARAQKIMIDKKFRIITGRM